VGNRTKEVSLVGTTNYAYDAADRLLSAGAEAFTYDRNGNELSKTSRQGTLAYAYDAANRLIGASTRGFTSAYTYDGDGNRVGQTVNGATYAYVNDVATSLPVVLNEQGPDGNITYGYGLGLIEEASSTFNYFYHYDGLGSAIALTDAAGKPQAAYAYDAWGNPLLNISDNVGTKNKFRFTGEALDPGSGLYYLRARYYDPSVGRFTSKDPFAGFPLRPLFLNTFLYVLNQPTKLVDPKGLSPEAPQSSFGTLPHGVMQPKQLTALMSYSSSELPGLNTANSTPAIASEPRSRQYCYYQELDIPPWVDIFMNIITIITSIQSGGLDPYGPLGPNIAGIQCSSSPPAQT
jgi:RHS repeat-associated protein